MTTKPTTEAAKPNLLLDYAPADRVLAAMHASTAPVRVIVGPRGSGKTSSAICELVRHARMMPPGLDGVRRSKALVVRASYPALIRSTLASVEGWLSAAPGYHTRMSTPPTTQIHAALDDGTRMEFDIEYMALADIPALQGVRGTEFSFCWIDEFTELNIQVVAAVSGSLGRYPSRNSFSKALTTGPDGRPVEPFRSFILMTTNPSAEGGDWHRWVESPPEGVEVFVQTGAYTEYTPAQAEIYLRHSPHLTGHVVERWGYHYIPSPHATFVRCISSGYAYWRRILLAAADRSEALTLVCARWATTRAGMPCWPHYSDEGNLSRQEVDPYPDAPLVVGIDQSGVHPAAVICQMQGHSLVILESLSPSDENDGVGFTEFVQEHLAPALAERYMGLKVQIVLDPACPRDALTARTALDVLTDNGMSATLGPTNNPRMRLDSVARRIARKGGLVVSRGPHTQHILAALRGAHHFGRAPDGSTKVSPAKGPASHVADALGYASTFLDVGGRTSSSTAGRSALFGKSSIAR